MSLAKLLLCDLISSLELKGSIHSFNQYVSWSTGYLPGFSYIAELCEEKRRISAGNLFKKQESLHKYCTKITCPKLKLFPGERRPKCGQVIMGTQMMELYR